MKRLTFEITIHAPRAKVFETMLDVSAYEQWSSVFNATSTFEGSWAKGSEIVFKGIDDDGNEGGMIGKIVENIPNKYVSIHYYGEISSGQRDTSPKMQEKYANAFENYAFADAKAGTSVHVELDVEDEYVDFFNQTWPKALQVLKSICEK